MIIRTRSFSDIGLDVSDARPTRAELRHAVRNARIVADALVESWNMKVDSGILPEKSRIAVQVWKETEMISSKLAVQAFTKVKRGLIPQSIATEETGRAGRWASERSSDRCGVAEPRRRSPT